MRIALGILLLIGGLLWSLPGTCLLVLTFDVPQMIQTGPSEYLVYHDGYVDIEMFGQPVSFATACAISLVPGAALVAIGLYFLFSGERRHARRNSDRAAD